MLVYHCSWFLIIRVWRDDISLAKVICLRKQYKSVDMIKDLVFSNFAHFYKFYNCVLMPIQYCAKVMQAKCPNFVLCSRELSMKVRAKVRAKIHGVSSDNSLEQRAIFRRIFGTSQKICDNYRYFAS